MGDLFRFRKAYDLSVFATGTVDQIQRALATNFGVVRFNATQSLSALNAPSLPAAVAAPVLGINGLRPLQVPAEARNN